MKFASVAFGIWLEEYNRVYSRCYDVFRAYVTWEGSAEKLSCFYSDPKSCSVGYTCLSKPISFGRLNCLRT